MLVRLWEQSCMVSVLLLLSLRRGAVYCMQSKEIGTIGH